jgi:hypothetical protein
MESSLKNEEWGIMKDLEKDRIRRFYSLKKDVKFKEFIDWIQESLEDERVANDSQLDTVKLRWGQGKAQNLREILATFSDLDEQIMELNNN